MSSLDRLFETIIGNANRSEQDHYIGVWNDLGEYARLQWVMGVTSVDVPFEFELLKEDGVTYFKFPGNVYYRLRQGRNILRIDGGGYDLKDVNYLKFPRIRAIQNHVNANYPVNSWDSDGSTMIVNLNRN